MTPSRQYTFSNSFATVPRERIPFVPLMRLIAKPFTGVKAIDDATLRLLRERKCENEKKLVDIKKRGGRSVFSLLLLRDSLCVCVCVYVCVCVEKSLFYTC